MTLASMKNNILRFVPGMQPDLIESSIQDAYRQLCLKDWNRLKLTTQIYTVPLYSTGTITIDASGAVTGVGTNFTSSMVGRHLRAYYSDAIFEITSFTDPTHIGVSGWTGLVISTAISYSILKIIYTLPTDVGVIFSVNYQTELRKKSQDYFNKFDPSRFTTGTAEWWAYAGMDNLTGAQKIEIYPVPYQTEPLRIYAKKKISPLNDSSSPPIYSLLPEDLVEAYALIICYNIRDAQQPDAGWGTRLQTQSPFYQALLDAAWDEDFELGATATKVLDTMGEMPYPQSNDYWSSHDVD